MVVAVTVVVNTGFYPGNHLVKMVWVKGGSTRNVMHVLARGSAEGAENDMLKASTGSLHGGISTKLVLDLATPGDARLS